MGKRKLKKYVLPSLIGIVGLSSCIGVSLYIESTKPVDSNYRFTISPKNEEIIPVINEVESKTPIKPFLEETVGKNIDFYSVKDDSETQMNSLVYYDKTYTQNTGILYSSDEIFDVVSVFEGTIKKVGEDNILGKYVEIEHENGYKTVYYSLSETSVTEGTVVQKGDVIGISGINKLEGIKENNLLFESYHDGYLMDPEEFYNVDFSMVN